MGIAGIVLVAGCSGGESASSGAYSDESGTQARPVAPQEAGTERDAGGAAGPAAPGQAGSGREAGGEPAKVRPEDDRAIVYTADLRVRAENVTQAAAEAKRQVTVAGGHVANERAASEPGIPPSVLVTFKIPAERYAATLDVLAAKLGTRLSLQQNSEDVTEAVADVDSRTRSAESALASFRKLLAKADTIGEVLSVEKEITDRESDLESLQARQKALAEQTRFATVTLRLESPPATPPVKAQDGFLSGLESGWHAFVVVGRTLATVVGWLLPFVAAGAVVLVPAWFGWRAVRRRRSPAGTEVAPEPPPAS